jgi:crotonobetainyl-CoA:carnitine CoA-transferase CaiB-like acyl-CoA transferase
MLDTHVAWLANQGMNYLATGENPPRLGNQIEATGTPIAPAYYLMFGAAVGLLAALFLRERARDAQLLVTDVVEPTAA